MRALSSTVFLVILFSLPLLAAEHRDVGLTQKGGRIEASVVPGPNPSAPTVLLVGGLAGNDDESRRTVTREIEAFDAIPQNQRPFRLIAIPLANPDAVRMQFPPTGVA